MTNLSVNINKVATLRNARGENRPCVEDVACDCESCKWQIVMSTHVPVLNPISVLAEAIDVEATVASNK